MDMPNGLMNGTSDAGSSQSMTMMMGPFTAQMGGMLWFQGWTPTTAPATFACCMGLFFLAVSSRYIDALRISCLPQAVYDRRRRFILGPECTCALLFMLWSLIMYLLMLAVMQYNAYYFIAILLGHGAGELGFGRYCHSTSVLREMDLQAGAVMVQQPDEEKSVPSR